VKKKKEILRFKNTVKPRIPIPRPGCGFKTKIEKIKNKKITLDNWDE
jgi:hypothetical protein